MLLTCLDSSADDSADRQCTPYAGTTLYVQQHGIGFPTCLYTGWCCLCAGCASITLTNITFI